MKFGPGKFAQNQNSVFVCIGCAWKISQALKFASLLAALTYTLSASENKREELYSRSDLCMASDLHIPCVAHFSCESRFPCAWKMQTSYRFSPGGVSLWYLTRKVSGVLRLADRLYYHKPVLSLAKTHTQQLSWVSRLNYRPQGATLEFKVA